VVKSATITVYSEMDPSSDVVRTLKKGDSLFVNLEIAGATGDWCSVSEAAHSAPLGYAACGDLEVSMPHFTVSPSLPEPTVLTGTPTGGEADSGASPGAGSGSGEKLNISIGMPSAQAKEAYRKLASEVVTDDGVNTIKLDQLDAAAQNGSPTAKDLAALGHILAGQYHYSQNDNSRAEDQFRAAIGLSANNPKLLELGLLDLAAVHLRLSEYSDALRSLDRVRQIDPRSAAAATLSGWADYGLDRVDKAIQEWQLSQQIAPNPGVAALLAKAQRDQKVERGFHEGETSHFILHYEGDAMPELAQAVMGALDQDFQTIEATLGYTPPEPITVILYTNRQFFDVTRAPSWADGINDGRIRVPVQGESQMTPQLAMVLKHELTHSFITQMTQGRAPTWLQEGLAQWMEGLRTGGEAEILVRLYDEKKIPPLADLEGPWNGFNAAQATVAYGWALATVEAIVANDQIWGLRRLLQDLTQDSSAAAAVRDSLQMTYPALNQLTAQYLKKAYLQ
jgi:tetratricopeptide (TPR) repeat protein